MHKEFTEIMSVKIGPLTHCDQRLKIKGSSWRQMQAELVCFNEFFGVPT